MLKLYWLLQEKMRNSCVAVGCLNVSNPFKNVCVHKYNDSEKKRGRLWRLVRTKQAKRGNSLPLYIVFSGFRYSFSIGKNAVPMIYTLIQPETELSNVNDNSEILVQLDSIALKYVHIMFHDLFRDLLQTASIVIFLPEKYVYLFEYVI